MDSDYYVSRKRKLLKEFDRTLDRIRGLFVSRYGEDSEAMLQEARQEYEALIPQLPYIGGRQPFTQFLISTAWFLSLYRVLKRRGETVEEVGQLLYQASEAYLQAYPRFTRRFLGFMSFSPRYLRRVKKGAQKSHERQYPGDYVFDYVKGDGTTFDYGVDYVECGPVKFLTKQGAPELAPYICPADILSSELLGWGLKRTATLAEGAGRCDFRFKKGGETQVAVPESLEKYVRSRGPSGGRDSIVP
jgi:hypothetical protein